MFAVYPTRWPGMQTTHAGVFTQQIIWGDQLIAGAPASRNFCRVCECSATIELSAGSLLDQLGLLLGRHGLLLSRIVGVSEGTSRCHRVTPNSPDEAGVGAGWSPAMSAVGW